MEILSKPANKTIGIVVFGTVITGIIAFYGISQTGFLKTSETPVVQKLPVVKKVAALGRLEPLGEVINLSAPLTLDGDRVAKLLVKQGDKVKVGDVIAILDSQKRLQDGVLQAKEQLKIAQAKLAQVKAGAKTGEIEAQKATIARLQTERTTQIQAQFATIAKLQAEKATEIQAQKATIARLKAEVDNANSEYQRYEKLFNQGAISTSFRDSKRLTLQTVQQQFNEAQANLNRIQASRQQELLEAQANLNRIQSSGSEQVKEAEATLSQISEIRPVDIQAVQTEVDNAKAVVKQAQTNLEEAYIRAPMTGQIIKIHTQQGEKIADQGIAELGQTQQMMVVAEVYQTDIDKVKLGQKVLISGQAFSDKLQGEVSQIGLQINRQNVFSNEPGENLDRRVVDVKIRLNPEDSKRVAGLTNLQVQTEIEL
ncbi:ABC exporter membrane fusion protein [Plectonema cf. radiosum LEGE 06105]|uniref:ABC exporter membrane fusion protein n=1 Tax=Plectonema cf. radiosum LEGE 06105 TaxID=945769 RepID=A0A8J7F168_9CYAN|nr:ABC exporter membrane fusion protein [Plectonema radiosum]MBE9214078.1 ABC exporter membrane fusion protein [Plectonema cf. radiosum LEGE 06105]